MSTLAGCSVCKGRAYVPAPGTAAPAIDACPACTRRAEIEWIEWIAREIAMKRIEHAPAGDAGTVTMEAVRVGTALMLEVVVRAAVLRAMPWYRGGVGVTILVTPYGGGQMDIQRAGTDGPYRLRARMDHPLDKLPPIQLRVPALPGMEAEEHPAEPVAYEVYSTTLTLLLPSWARRTPQPRTLDVAGGVA